MHNGGKVGASAVGEIIRKNMKVAINPFPEGKYIIAKSHNLATHFSYGSERYEQLLNLAYASSGAHGEWIKLCLYLNVTRIYARQ